MGHTSQRDFWRDEQALHKPLAVLGSVKRASRCPSSKAFVTSEVRDEGVCVGGAAAWREGEYQVVTPCLFCEYSWIGKQRRHDNSQHCATQISTKWNGTSHTTSNYGTPLCWLYWRSFGGSVCRSGVVRIDAADVNMFWLWLVYIAINQVLGWSFCKQGRSICRTMRFWPISVWWQQFEARGRRCIGLEFYEVYSQQ